MDAQEFKRVFGKIAKDAGFTQAHGGWFRESKESVMSLDLQKSSYSRSYYLNINICIQGMFDRPCVKCRDVITGDLSNLFRRSPKEYDIALNLESELSPTEREHLLAKMFNEFIKPFSEKTLSISGVLDLIAEEHLSAGKVTIERLHKIKSGT